MIECRVEVKAQQVEMTSDELLLLGVDTITWLDASNQPIYEPLPGELIVWPNIIISALITKSGTLEAIQRYLDLKRQQNLVGHFQFNEIPNEDWTRLTLKQFQRTQFGERLWIIPSHEQHDFLSNHAVILDPGFAFGTGSHASTALCLEWLDRNVRAPVTLIDYGCGSGILAIAAIKLGAAQSFAVDYDPQALLACQMNAAANHVLENIVICDPQQLPEVTGDILIANIISNSLIKLVEVFVDLLKPGGKIVLSGILKEQVPEVIATFKSHFEMTEPIFKEDWALLEGSRRKY